MSGRPRIPAQPAFTPPPNTVVSGTPGPQKLAGTGTGSKGFTVTGVKPRLPSIVGGGVSGGGGPQEEETVSRRRTSGAGGSSDETRGLLKSGSSRSLLLR